MLRIPTDISWTADHVPIEGRAWVIYVSRTRREKGVCWARCWIRDRHCRIQLWEGIWYVRVLMETCDCTEEPWERAEIYCHQVTGREHTPVVPTNVGCGVLTDGAAIASDPPRVDAPPHRVQVVECHPGSGRGYGVVRDEYETHPGGVLEDPGHGVKRRFRMSGSVKVPGATVYHTPTRELCVGTVGLAGKRGGGKTDTGLLPEMFNHQAIQIAQVDTAGGTSMGFPATAPFASDLFEYDAAEGFRTLFLPPQSDAATYASMGPVDGPGTFNDLPFLAPTTGRVVIPTATTDLGAPMVFVLEAYARFRRTTTVQEPFKVKEVCSLRGLPMNPAHDDPDHLPSEHHQDFPQDYGPNYLFRDTLQGGEPRNPLRFCRFEYELDGGGWKVHVPGQILLGQMIQVRMILFDETGWFQVASGDVEIRARFPERVVRMTVPSLAFMATSVVLPVHPVSGGPLFPNQMVVTATAWGAGNAVPHIVTVFGQGPGVAGFVMQVWNPLVGGPAVVGDMVDVIVSGW